MSKRLENAASGIPLEFMLNFHTLSNNQQFLKNYCLQSNIPLEIFDLFVSKARKFDTFDLYFTGKTFARSQIRDTSIRWHAKPGHLEFLEEIAAKTKIPFKDIFDFDSAIHWKRTRGSCVNPSNPGQDIVYYCDLKSASWFDVTPCDGPPPFGNGGTQFKFQNGTGESVVDILFPNPNGSFSSSSLRSETTSPFKRRKNCMYIVDPSDPRYADLIPKTCRCCLNRFTEPLLGCALCRETFYCTKDCQKYDWKVHKRECKKKP